MSPEVLDDVAIEKNVQDHFAHKLDIAEVIVRGAPVGNSARATIFKTTNGQVYVYIRSQSSLVRDDVQKIIRRMACEAENYLPPRGDKEYFDRIGREKFAALFPGKQIVSEDDLRYYKSIALYNPALVRLSKIKGEIRAFDKQLGMWRKVKDYAYSKIKTN